MSQDSDCSAPDPELILKLVHREIHGLRAHVQAALQAESRGDWARATEALTRGAAAHARVKQLLVHVPPADKAALIASLQRLGASLR